MERLKIQIEKVGIPFLPNINSFEDLFDKIHSRNAMDIGAWIVTINSDIHRQLFKRHDELIALEVESKALKTADGFPIQYLAKLLLNQPMERVTGVDILERLVDFSIKHKIPVVIAGGKNGDSILLESKLQSNFPAGKFFSLELPFATSNSLSQILLEKIPFPKFTLLLGVGALKSEEIILELLPSYPNSIYLGCGAAISYHAGTSKRSPRFLTILQLEWFWRMTMEPHRLFKRYILKDLPHLLKLGVIFFLPKLIGKGGIAEK